jgi:hypothetical protein
MTRASRGALYVETLIHADMDRIWELTQRPESHARWDLRFSSIVPVSLSEQGHFGFRYERRLPFHVIQGTGVSLGEKERPDGTRTSALRFRTDDRLSPLRSGRGYWRYIPTPNGIRFITGYEYVPGFGRIPDLLIRPLVLWMTAWSFDRLRIWAETDTPPEKWGLWSVAAWWLPGRPRARRCRTTPPASGAMSSAPSTLRKL